ncbi:hypothetical protein MKK68_00285 [Methylobacterium sp. E-016]|uniref:hypothetical protein n=1 Tax=Methylobacterium sp. E-016 TaxID=2836556 RepID=UPI001FBA03E4|nr:hypothetical protein [Methylobacterium sp. E-016]MCJ2074100.1 hypothetical protein [Methylobacterium sp. E-016]
MKPTKALRLGIAGAPPGRASRILYSALKPPTGSHRTARMVEIENPQLQAIARALNVKPETLFAEATEDEVSEAATLIRLWLRITDPQGRRRVLSVARQEAEISSYQE